MSNQQSPTDYGDQATVVRGEVTGFEQGIAALAGLFTAGPLGALASWAAIKGVQGKWAPWFILGIPSAIAINAFYFGMFILFGNAVNNISDRQNPAQQSPIRQNSYPREINQLQATSATPNPRSTTYSQTRNYYEDLPPGKVHIATMSGDSASAIKSAEGALRYNNGNIIIGTFIVDCTNKTLEPRDFIFRSRAGKILKAGQVWEPQFKTRWGAEVLLVSSVCE
jgi:hypothetical protein